MYATTPAPRSRGNGVSRHGRLIAVVAPDRFNNAQAHRVAAAGLLAALLAAEGGFSFVGVPNSYAVCFGGLLR